MDNIYVLDTNIILKEPNILYQLPNSKVIIPSIVLQELDNFKNKDEDGLLKRNGRAFVKFLDELHDKNYHIVETNTTVELKIVKEYDKEVMNALGGEYTNDDKIIYAAYEENQKNPTLLVSDDGLVRLKGRSVGLDVLSFTSKDGAKKIEDIYSGYIQHFLPDELIHTIFNQEYLDISHLSEYEIYPHMFFILRGYTSNGSALVKVTPDCKAVELVENITNVWGINPKNAQQNMALNILLDDDIHLVTLIGKAGTGKTLLALASGLALTQDEQVYDSMLCLKPTVDMGKGIGFLPGDKAEKLAPYAQSFFDNLEQLFGGKEKYESAMAGIRNIEIDAITYIRGRSIPKQYIIIDEAQNLTKHEVKTIITRAGEGAKIILMGDPEQIDHPFLDAYSNGLSYVVDKFKDQSIAAHIRLEKSERSLLAEIASKIL